MDVHLLPGPYCKGVVPGVDRGAASRDVVGSKELR